MAARTLGPLHFLIVARERVSPLLELSNLHISVAMLDLSVASQSCWASLKAGLLVEKRNSLNRFVIQLFLQAVFTV